MSDSGEADNDTEVVKQREDHAIAGPNDSDEAYEAYEAKVVVKGGRSVVWEYFVFKGNKVEGPNKKKVFCKLCERNVKKGKLMPGIAYCGGTTNLNNPRVYSTPYLVTSQGSPIPLNSSDPTPPMYQQIAPKQSKITVNTHPKIERFEATHEYIIKLSSHDNSHSVFPD